MPDHTMGVTDMKASEANPYAEGSNDTMSLNKNLAPNTAATPIPGGNLPTEGMQDATNPSMNATMGNLTQNDLKTEL